MITGYPEVDHVLGRLWAGVESLLGDNFVGMYLYGSLAMDAFDPATSDIDFLVVTRTEIDDVAPLAAMHRELAASLDSKWALELEGAYISRAALRRYDPANCTHPHIDRGSPALVMEYHHTDWVIQRYVLREHGLTLVGPPIKTLLDPIGPEELRAALLELMRVWWEPMTREPGPLDDGHYQAYAVQTMCRILYTVEHGTVISKPAAAHWALERLDVGWRPLIEQARAWTPDQPMDALPAVQALIRHTWARLNGSPST